MQSEGFTSEGVSRDTHAPAYAAPKTAGEQITGPYRGETYYDMPPVKSSYYGWKTALSFVAEGMGGVSQILATIVDLLGREEDRAVVRAGRYLALGGSAVAPALFIADLHTPHRWYNMLRIFRRTSPMSIGSWSLVSFAAFNVLTAGGQILEDAGYRQAGRLLGRIFQIPAVGFGGIVSLYAGTEIEETSLPLWGRSFPLLAPLMAAASASSAGAAIKAATGAGLSPGTRRRLDGLSLNAGLAELFLIRSALRNWKGRNGDSGRLSRFSFKTRIGSLLTLLQTFRMANGWLSRKFPLLMPLLALAADVVMRQGILSAGNESGRHPRDYFSFTQPGAAGRDHPPGPHDRGNGSCGQGKRHQFKEVFDFACGVALRRRRGDLDPLPERRTRWIIRYAPRSAGSPAGMRRW